MDIIEMFADFCERAPGDMTIEKLIATAKNNHILIEDDCFIIFSTVFDEVHMLFPYAARGKSIEPIRRKLESWGKDSGFKRIKIITRRDKSFARKFPDYEPIGVLFEKELI